MFKDFFNKDNFKENFKVIFNNIKSKITNSYSKARQGEENLNVILYYWSLIPIIIYFLIWRFTELYTLKKILDIFMLFLLTLDLYFISKAVKVHPEYDTKLTKEKEKQEYYKTLSDEELKKVKEEESKERRKKILNKYIFLKYEETTDAFKMIRVLIIIVLLIIIKKIFF